jgi:Flp pilus assembly protein CpaB
MGSRLGRRGRAGAFLLAALFAAAGAAAIADGYGRSVARGYGELRPVVVAGSRLAAGEPIAPGGAAELEVRRVPLRFVPPGALRSPVAAVGLVPVAAVPAGGYLLASQLRPPRPPRVGPPLGGDRRPVEIAVNGADALLVGGGDPVGSAVDVVVTSEPSAGGSGRTYVAAAGAPLLALGPGAEGTGAGGSASVTLGLTRSQALRLIAAQSFARAVTVLPSR